MVQLANKKKRVKECLHWKDWVYLKLQPYRQVSVTNKEFNKLLVKFYGPYKIIECIGTVAYKLELPSSATIHPVFHVSQLKRHTGNRKVLWKATWILDWASIPASIDLRQTYDEAHESSCHSSPNHLERSATCRGHLGIPGWINLTISFLHPWGQRCADGRSIVTDTNRSRTTVGWKWKRKQWHG